MSFYPINSRFVLTRFLPLYVLCLLPVALSAQLTQLVNPYVFRVLFLNDVSEVGDGMIELGINLEFESKGEVFRVAAYSGKLTRYFRYTGSPDLVFFREGMSGEGELVRIPQVSVNLGAAGDKLVIIMSSPTGSLKAMVQDVGAGSLALGDVRIMNFTQHQVAVKIGEEVAKVNSSQARDLSPGIAAPRKMERLALAVMDGDMTYMLENRRVLFRRDESKLILVYPSLNDEEGMAYMMVDIKAEAPPQTNHSDEVVELYDRKSLELEASKIDEYGMREYN